MGQVSGLHSILGGEWIVRWFGLALGVIVVASIAAPAEAQDSQYWTQRYGTSSRLMGGAVIGSVQDLSAGYYNPGALALVGGAKFVLSARVFVVQSVTFGDIGPNDKRQSIVTAGTAPSFVGGLFTMDEKKPNQWGYIYLARQRFSLNVDKQRVFSDDLLPNIPGDEDFAGNAYYNESLSEYWGGLVWAHKYRENVGFGATWFVAYRGQSWRDEFVAQVYSDSTGVASSKVIRDYNYHNWRTLLKLGLAYNREPFTFGFSLTTPSLNILGDGYSFVDEATSGFDTDGNGSPDDTYAANLQQNAKSNFPTSWAIGAGAAYQLNKTELTASAEWFAPVDQFDVLETTSFQSQSTGETLPNSVVAEYKSIVNVGAGINHRFTSGVTAYGSFTTDFTAVVPDKTNTALTTWNLYHTTGGCEFTFRRFQFTLGAEWAIGKSPIDHLDFSAADESGGFQNAGSATVTYNELTFLVGLQINGDSQ